MFSILNCNKVNIRRVTSFDSYGEPLLPEVQEVKGKLEYKFKRVTDKNGADVVSSGTFRTESVLNDTDEIEIKGEYKPFLEVQPQTDFSGKTVYYIGWF